MLYNCSAQRSSPLNKPDKTGPSLHRTGMPSASKRPPYQHEVTLDNIGEHLHLLTSLQRPEATLADILIDVKEATRVDKGTLAEHAGIGRSTLSRLLHHETHSLRPVKVERIAERLRLPLQALMLANSMGSMSELQRKSAPAQRQAGDLDSVRDSFVWHVAVNSDEYRRLESIRDCRQYILANGILETSPCPLPSVRRNDRFLVQHRGHHMHWRHPIAQSKHEFSVFSRKQIPDGAIVEVEIQPESWLRGGDIVFVQFPADDAATFYVYDRHVDEGGIGYELFLPCNWGCNVRICHRVSQHDASMASQRTLIGRAISIVHHDLTAPDSIAAQSCMVNRSGES